MGDGPRGGVLRARRDLIPAGVDPTAELRAPLSTGPVEAGEVQSVAFSPDGKALAVGYGDGVSRAVVLGNAESRRILTAEPLPVKEGEVSCLAFSPDGRTLAVGYHADQAWGAVLWDVAARRPASEQPLLMKEHSDGY